MAIGLNFALQQNTVNKSPSTEPLPKHPRPGINRRPIRFVENAYMRTSNTQGSTKVGRTEHMLIDLPTTSLIDETLRAKMTRHGVSGASEPSPTTLYRWVVDSVAV